MHNKIAAYAKRLWLVDPDRFSPYIARVMSYATCYTREQLDAQRAELEAKADQLELRGIVAGGRSFEEEAKVEAPKAIRAVKGKIGVIPIHGPVDQHWSSELAKSGGTSLDFVSRALDIGLAAPGVGAIILHMDCPGGVSYGVQELSDKIYKARADKPIYAMIDSMACSAGLWIASAASMVICTPGGDTGSVGVYRMHIDESQALANEGVAVTFIHAGKYKVEFAPTSPLSDDARARMQERVDATHDKFIGALKKNRDTSADNVRKNYGEGRVLSADEALAVGMIDRIMTYEDLLAKLTGDGAGTQAVGASMAAGVDKEKLRIREDRRRKLRAV